MVLRRVSSCHFLAVMSEKMVAIPSAPIRQAEMLRELGVKASKRLPEALVAAALDDDRPQTPVDAGAAAGPVGATTPEPPALLATPALPAPPS